MTSPDPSGPAYEADLGHASDTEWFEAHARLTELLTGTDFPEEELTFIWDPELSPTTLIDFSAETDHGPSYTDPEEETDGSA